MFPWIKIPDRIYDAAILAALAEQDRIWSSSSVALFTCANDDVKEKIRRVYRAGFSALLREWL